MNKVTKLEKAVLISIVENECTPLNGGIPENYDECEGTWTDSVSYGGPRDVECPEGKVLSGVFSSLIKKGLIYSFEYDKKWEQEPTVCLSEEGFKIYQTFNRK